MTSTSPSTQPVLRAGDQRYLEQANAAAAQYAERAAAQATLRAYSADFADFQAWCEPLGLSPVPATPEAVSAYLGSLADSGYKARTLDRRKAAIAFAHRWEGVDTPTTSDRVKKTLRGIKRRIGTAPEQAPSATADIVERVIASIPPSTKADYRDRALILLGFAGAFRRSELVGIDVEHIRRTREGIVVHLGKSKTDQEGRGHTVAIPNGRVLRPVAALDAWLAEADIRSGPVFRPIGKGDKLKVGRLSAWSANEIIRQRFEKAGFEGFSAHSLRAGFLTSALENGADIFRAADQGRWRKLETVREYDRRAKLFRDHAGGGVL